MKYNFDEITNRRGTASFKWDSDTDADILPLWVADMDFRTAPAVTEAVCRRAETGIYGYVRIPESYYDSLVSWFDRRHGWTIDRRRVICVPGVVPAVSAIIKALVEPGQGVILQTPAYNCFFSSVRNNDAVIVENKLRRVERGNLFTYEIDFDELERQAADPQNRLLVLCNPQNPTGRVWSRGELERICEICRRHEVRVLSDEIHCELVRHGSVYTPYATVDDRAIVCCSPSKAFNTAGLQIANIVCPDPVTQSLVDHAVNVNEVCDVNPFGVVGLQAAYNEGGEWLDRLNVYLDGNFDYLCRRFAEELPRLRVCESESTYLAWVDISATGMTSEEVARELHDRGRVRISPGEIYGDTHCIRINYACPRSRLSEAVDRMAAVLAVLQRQH